LAGVGWSSCSRTTGFEPHLVHPSRCKAIASARLKNDKVDAHILAQLLRADLRPEAWIAPPAVRQLRAVLRLRIGLVRLRTLLRNRIHAVLADHGHHRAEGCWTGPGRQWLAGLPLPAGSREVIADCLALIDAIQVPIDRLDAEVSAHARADPRVKVLTAPGVGPLPALVIVAGVGDITRSGYRCLEGSQVIQKHGLQVILRHARCQRPGDRLRAAPIALLHADASNEVSP
jgi:transposase